MRQLTIGLFAILTLASTARPAQALPISYEGTVSSGIPVTGTSTQDDTALFPPSFFGDDPVGADYWRMDLAVGARVNVVGRRDPATSSHFDMDLWIFAGEYTDTDDFGGFLTTGNAFTPATPGFVALFQDELLVPTGPFGDPRGFFIAPTTGTYTFIVTSGLSDVGSPDDYTLQADIVPEPGTLVLLGTGLALAARASRRRVGHPTERR